MGAAEDLGAALARSLPGGPANPDAARDRPTEPLRLLVADVVSVDSATDTVTIRTDGTNERVSVPSLVALSGGEVVFVLEQPPMLLVLGPVAAQ